MKKLIFSSVFVCLICLLFQNPLFAGKGRVGGTVTDPDGNPIKGAKIVTTNPRYLPGRFETETDDKGRFTIMGFDPGNWSFDFTAEGYVPYQTSLKVQTISRNRPMEIIMDPIVEETEGLQIEDMDQFTHLSDEAILLYEEGNYEEALEKFIEIRDTAEEQVEPDMLTGLYLNIGKCCLRMKDYDRAISSYEKVLADSPGDIGALQDIAECYIKKKDFDSARAYFEQWIETNPEDSAVYYNVAEVYFRSGEIENAREYYHRALELQPGWAKVHLKLGYLNLNLANDSKAVEHFETFIELAPGDPQAGQIQNLINTLKAPKSE